MDRRVLLLGGLCTEPILSALHSSDLGYINKLLSSSSKNWREINRILGKESRSGVAAIAVQISEATLIRSCLPSYGGLLYEILHKVEEYPHVLLIYGPNLKQEFSRLNREGGDVGQQFRFLTTSDINFLTNHEKIKEKLGETVSYITSGSLRVAPYLYTSELTASVLGFLQDFEEGLVFRFYVPAERIHSAEVDKLLDLFQNYLTSVMSRPIALEKRKTATGTVYSFFSRHGAPVGDFKDSLAQFSSFLALCANDPEKASDVLLRTSIPNEKISSVVNRFGREVRRLIVDIEYGRKIRLLEIEHTLYAELSESLSSGELKSVRDEVEGRLPTVVGDQASCESLISNTISAPVVAREWQHTRAWSKASSIIDQGLDGITLTENDQKLLELLRFASEDEKSALKSALYELKDVALARKDKSRAWQRIQVFLARATPLAGQAVVKVIEAYVTHLLTA